MFKKVSIFIFTSLYLTSLTSCSMMNSPKSENKKKSKKVSTPPKKVVKAKPAPAMYPVVTETVVESEVSLPVADNTANNAPDNAVDNSVAIENGSPVSESTPSQEISNNDTTIDQGPSNVTPAVEEPAASEVAISEPLQQTEGEGGAGREIASENKDEVNHKDDEDKHDDEHESRHHGGHRKNKVKKELKESNGKKNQKK